MYQSFEAKNFRCFRDFAIQDLARVNLIAGFNNVGKTALVEALFLHCGAYNPGLINNLLGHRGIPRIVTPHTERAEGPWASVFRGFDTSANVQLRGQFDDGNQRTLRLRVVRDPVDLTRIRAMFFPPQGDADNQSLPFSLTHVLELEYRGKQRDGKVYLILGPHEPFVYPKSPPAPFPAFIVPAGARVPIGEDAQRFSDLEVAGQQEVLLESLRIIEPRLVKLSLNVSGGLTLIHAQRASGPLMPLVYFGEGMVRIASMVLEIASARGGVVLVDEIENGIHHSILQDLWKVIAETTQKFGAQVVATTHSWECILAAHRAFAGSPEYDFRLHRLDRVDDAVRAVTYDKDSIEGAIKARLEVR